MSNAVATFQIRFKQADVGAGGNFKIGVVALGEVDCLPQFNHEGAGRYRGFNAPFLSFVMKPTEFAKAETLGGLRSKCGVSVNDLVGNSSVAGVQKRFGCRDNGYGAPIEQDTGNIGVDNFICHQRTHTVVNYDDIVCMIFFPQQVRAVFNGLLTHVPSLYQILHLVQFELFDIPLHDRIPSLKQHHHYGVDLLVAVKYFESVDDDRFAVDDYKLFGRMHVGPRADSAGEDQCDVFWPASSFSRHMDSIPLQFRYGVQLLRRFISYSRSDNA